MPPENESPARGSPADWLRHARADLAMATAPLPVGGLYSTLCFHAQQAAEKSLKAVLIKSGIEVPRTHSLERLLDLLPSSLAKPAVLDELSDLTPFATMYRYPYEDDEADVTLEQYRAALALARKAYAWADAILKAGGNP
jgi:HEPN domain-containing protein